MLDFINTDIYSYISIAIIFILIIISIYNSIRIRKMNKRYKSFMKKLGNGNNIEDSLKKYIEKVDVVNDENKEIKEFCTQINKNIAFCIQKIGIVRYSAFKDTGSDLSFALALLDDNNNGVILNGIYSREMSNIYAKQVKMGKATNNLSQEEEEALNQAIEHIK